jgi:hypothetical protein
VPPLIGELTYQVACLRDETTWREAGQTTSSRLGP